MRAYQLRRLGEPGMIVEVPTPEPGPGEVSIRMGAVGLCHTDLHFMGPEATALFDYPVPFTLGHENAGWVHRLGPGVAGLREGDPVVVAGGPRCGRCLACRRGRDNLCAERGTGRGFGRDGGLAEFLVVAQREVVALGSLPLAEAAPLPDAGVTPYHAIKRLRSRLEAGSTALVIGAGGLGGFAVQFLRLLTPAAVVAVDTSPRRLETVRALGVDHALDAAEDLEAHLDDVTGGAGVDAVLDFVGTDATMARSLAVVRPGGAVAIVGAAGGTVAIGWGALPVECDVFIPIGGTTAELQEVVALAETGRIRSIVDVYPFDEVAQAYRRVAAGEVEGRAVVDPSA